VDVCYDKGQQELMCACVMIRDKVGTDVGMCFHKRHDRN
jgi:hypothetical protein